jgi:hypothetical protein
MPGRRGARDCENIRFSDEGRNQHRGWQEAGPSERLGTGFAPRADRFDCGADCDQAIRNVRRGKRCGYPLEKYRKDRDRRRIGQVGRNDEGISARRWGTWRKIVRCGAFLPIGAELW